MADGRSTAGPVDVVFAEVLHATRPTRVLLYGLGVALVGLQLGLAAAGSEEIGWFYLPIVLFSFGVCVAVARMSSVVVVGSDSVTLRLRLGGVPVYRRRLRGADIQRVEEAAADAMSAGGLGLRFMGGGHVALMVRQGAAVRIVLTDGYRQYLVTTSRAPELLAALTALAASPK